MNGRASPSALGGGPGRAEVGPPPEGALRSGSSAAGAFGRRPEPSAARERSSRPRAPSPSLGGPTPVRPGPVLTLLAAVLATACARPPEPAGGTPTLEALFTGGVAAVDLTHALSPDAPYWPGPEHSPFGYDTLARNPDGSPAMGAYSVPEHFGTHLDAPVHSAERGRSVDRIPIERLLVQAVVVDVREAVSADPDYAVSEEDVRAWELRHGPVPRSAVVLARTGWAERWTRPGAYYPVGEDGLLHFPGFGADAVRFLVEERDVAGIGIDTGSVDPGAADGFPVHGLAGSAGLYHLENLADLTALPEAGAYLVVAPVKIRGGSGGQARVFAVVP